MTVECEWDDDHGPAFASVYTTGFCGGDQSAVCASCFLDEVEVHESNGQASFGGRRIPDNEVYVITGEGKGETVPLEVAIERAKAITGSGRGVTYAELTEA